MRSGPNELRKKKHTERKESHRNECQQLWFIQNWEWNVCVIFWVAMEMRGNKKLCYNINTYTLNVNHFAAAKMSYHITNGNYSWKNNGHHFHLVDTLHFLWLAHQHILFGIRALEYPVLLLNTKKKKKKKHNTRTTTAMKRTSNSNNNNEIENYGRLHLVHARMAHSVTLIFTVSTYILWLNVNHCTIFIRTLSMRSVL